VKKNTGTAIGLLATGALAGGIAMATLPASAADSGSTTTTPSTTTTSTSASTAAQAAPRANAKSSTPVRSDEKSVATDLNARLKAAALKAVPGGTVYRIETDGDGSAYEAHMTKADGSLVTVKFNSSGTVTAVEAGMGKGGPAGAGAGTPPSGSTTG
jgi:anti-sigma factor RsiW